MGSTLFAPRCLGSGTILYGSFTSLQYASMNTLVYADISEQDACSASSIASPMQQMLISFGAATAGLGIQKALSAGMSTIASTIVFHSLKSRDGDDVGQHQVLHPGGWRSRVMSPAWSASWDGRYRRTRPELDCVLDF
jgi:hypothetical protein